MRKSLVHAALRCGIVLAVAMGCAAQDRTIHHAMRVKVKPERMGDWQAALKEYNAHLKKAGWDRTTYYWQSVTGPNEFVRVRYFAKFADIPQGPNPRLKEIQADLTALMVRMQQCTASVETRIAQVDMELSLPRPAEVPRFVRVAHTTIKQGNADAYRELLKTMLFPAVKSAGMKSYSTMRVQYGGARTEYLSAAGFNSLADLDEQAPVVKAMGDEKFRLFGQRLAELIERSEWNIYRFRDDLSYIAAPAGTPSGN